jgi:hypothetical protein
MRKPLTDVLVRSVEAPAIGRLEITDLRCIGLTLRVTKGGVKSWSFRFRDPESRKLTRATIGAYPTVSLQVARERALDLTTSREWDQPGRRETQSAKRGADSNLRSSCGALHDGARAQA